MGRGVEGSMMQTKIVELILTYTLSGDGSKEDPVRACEQLWTKAGLLVAASDPHTS